MIITAFFTNSGVPTSGLSAIIRIRDLFDNSLVITDAAMSDVGDGHYKYDYTLYDSTKDYAIRCDGGVVLSFNERYTYAGNENYYDDVRNSVWSDQVSGYSPKSAAGALQVLLYGDQIYVDEDSLFSGTDFGVGTKAKPVNNIGDALLIANGRRIKRISLLSSVTVDADDNISEKSIETIGILGTTVTLTTGCSAANSVFKNLNITGELINGDAILLNDCSVLDFDNFSGIMNNVAFGDNAEINLGIWATIIQGTAGGSAGSEPEIVIGTADLNMSNWTGNINLKGKTGTNRTVLNTSSGNIIIDSSCVSGSIQLLGVGQIESDNSGPNCNVDIEGFISNENIADFVWDEQIDGHGSDGTTGKKLKDLAASVVLTGTVAGSGNGVNQLELDNFASSVDGAYDPALVTITDGPGDGQTRGIFQYDGTNRVITVDRDWKVYPITGISKYVITAWAGREHVNEGLARGGTLSTITLNTLASPVSGNYIRQRVFIRSGTGEDQVRTITAYDGTTKVATVDVDWNIVPDLNSAYVMIPARGETKESIASAVWDEPLANHADDETTGHALLQQSYDNAIYIDVVNGTPGTVYPAGIRQSPVNSLADALTLSSNYELSHFHIIGSLTISGGEDISGYTFDADRSLGNSVTLVNPKTELTYFNDLTVSGTLSGAARFTFCVLGEINNLSGGIKNSLTTNDVNFIAGGNNYMTECDTFVTDPLTFININISDSNFNMIRGRGQYAVLGKTSTNVSSFDLNGTVRVDSTCVSGTIVIAGLTRIIDESGPNCLVLQAALTNTSITNAVWNEELANHTIVGTYGAELATKADIAASTSTSFFTAVSGGAIFGTETNTYTSTFIKDGVYWQIQENAVTGITAELIFNIPDEDRAGVFTTFGRYTGTPSNTHYMDLDAYNYEADVWENLVDQYMPGGFVSNAEYTHEYYERHIDRTNNNEVRIRIRHHITSYNANHILYLDYCAVTSVEVITAKDIAVAVWSEPTSGYGVDETFGLVLRKALGLMHENIYIDNPVYDGDTNLTSARVRIYSDPSSTGTANDVIGTYEITAPGSGPGKFITWKQIKV
jgi:hypothetical protein